MMTSFRTLALGAIACSILGLSSIAAVAQKCGTDYVVKDGDSLSKLAVEAYGDSNSWTVIFYSNQDRLGTGNSLMVPGQRLRIPCLDGVQRKPKPADQQASPATDAQPIVLSNLIRRVDFLTADEYRPFTDRSLTNGGMMTDIMVSAMNVLKEQSKGRLDFNVNWVNDWSAHLSPLLSSRAFDMGFPWHRPTCENFESLSNDAKSRCERFFFSDPLFEVLILFFTKKGSEFQYANDRAVEGRNLCRPIGWSTFFLDNQGRNWLKDNKITLLRPQTLEECFRLVDIGAVDAVVTDEFSGRSAMAQMGIEGKIDALTNPVAIEPLHVIVSKTHPKSRILVHYVNSAIRRLRETGEYDDIINRHLTEFWAKQRPAGAGAVGAAASGATTTPGTPGTAAAGGTANRQ